MQQHSPAAGTCRPESRALFHYHRFPLDSLRGATADVWNNRSTRLLPRTVTIAAGAEPDLNAIRPCSEKNWGLAHIHFRTLMYKNLPPIQRYNCTQFCCYYLILICDTVFTARVCDAMRCAVLVIVILSVCLSVCPSVRLSHTRWLCPHGRPTIMISSPL